MTERKPCKECPWTNQNRHSLKFRNYVEKMNSIGKIKNYQHACHMITSDVWGLKTKINKNNICKGTCKKINYE